MNTEKAKELLRAATCEQAECTCFDPEIAHDEECPWLRYVTEMPRAVGRVSALGPDLLALAIGAVEALDIAHDFCCGDFEEDQPCTKENCQVQAALTAWEKLWEARR